MKAAVLHEFKTPLSLEDVPRPQPGPGEVLIEVEVCGVCHSDLHVADGDWKQLAGIVKKPLILGHEIVGRVVERGAGVDSEENITVGDRVGVPWVHWTCGQCEFCREGNENLCVQQRITGVMVDGGYAEFAKAPASHVVKVPDTLPSEQGSAAALRGSHSSSRSQAIENSRGATAGGFRCRWTWTHRNPDWPGGGSGSDCDRYFG